MYSAWKQAPFAMILMVVSGAILLKQYTHSVHWIVPITLAVVLGLAYIGLHRITRNQKTKSTAEESA